MLNEVINRKIAAVLFMFTLFICVSCKQSQKKQTLIDADWIIGTWKGTTQNNYTFYERWTRSGDTLFSNTNYHFENGDTVIGGTSEIVLRHGEVFYVNGKGEKQVSWRASEFSPTSMTFQNGAISTYQTIIFNLNNKNQWTALLVTPKDTIRYSLDRIN